MKKGSLFFFGILFSIASCVEKIDFSTETADFKKKLVVDGYITNGNGPFFVKLSNSSFINDFGTHPQKGATMTLFDDQGNQETAIYVDSIEQYVFLGTNVKGEVGHSYHIEIKLPSGECFESIPEIMPPPVKVDSISLQFTKVLRENFSKITIESDAFEVFIHTKIDQPDTYLRWSLEEAYSFSEIENSNYQFDVEILTCYFDNIPISPQIIPLYKSTDEENTTISFPIGEKILDIDALIHYKDTNIITVYQYTITKIAYEYWNDQKLVLEQSGNIFDATPATVNGNIYSIDENIEKPLGYFGAASIDTFRRYDISLVYKNNLGPIVNYCNIQPVEDVCFDCSLFRHASLIRPPYFGE